jgi:hypothetical protein
MIASDAVTGPSQSDTTALVSKVRGSTSAEIGCWPAPEHRRTETPDVDHKSAWPGGMRHNLELCYSHRRNRSGLPNSAVLDQGGGAPRRCGPPRMFAVQTPQQLRQVSATMSSTHSGRLPGPMQTCPPGVWLPGRQCHRVLGASGSGRCSRVIRRSRHPGRA